MSNYRGDLQLRKEYDSFEGEVVYFGPNPVGTFVSLTRSDLEGKIIQPAYHSTMELRNGSRLLVAIESDRPEDDGVVEPILLWVCTADFDWVV